MASAAEDDELFSAFQSLSVSTPASPPRSASSPCPVCGFALPDGWGESPTSPTSSLPFYFSRLRASDAGDVAAKLGFWLPLLRGSQRHRLHPPAHPRHPLTFSAEEMRRRFQRVGALHHCQETAPLWTPLSPSPDTSSSASQDGDSPACVEPLLVSARGRHRTLPLRCPAARPLTPSFVAVLP